MSESSKKQNRIEPKSFGMTRTQPSSESVEAKPVLKKKISSIPEVLSLVHLEYIKSVSFQNDHECASFIYEVPEPTTTRGIKSEKLNFNLDFN